MFSVAGSEDYFNVPDLLPQDGGLQAMDENDDEEEEEEDEREMDVSAQELIVFPEPEPHLEHDYKGSMRMQREYIPSDFLSIPPHVMNALSRLKEEMSKQKAVIMMHAVLPIIVHSSPLMSLFSSTPVLPPNVPMPKEGVPRIWIPTYTSFVYSAFQLHQLYLACIGGLIGFSSNVTAEMVSMTKAAFQRQLEMAESVHNDELDALFRDAASGEHKADDIVARFIDQMQRYALQYVHLFEYVIHSLVIAPRCELPLEAVLTPNTCVSLDMCLPDERDRVLHDTHAFFRYKSEERRFQEAKNKQEGKDNVDVTPHIDMPPDTVERNFQHTNFLFKGHIPLRTIYEYMWYLDTEGMLTECKWNWQPK